ncbi:MAG: hypothetical protein WC661_19900 [Opitutaceae bacterium]|jgi:hypothetical protein
MLALVGLALSLSLEAQTSAPKRKIKCSLSAGPTTGYVTYFDGDFSIFDTHFNGKYITYPGAGTYWVGGQIEVEFEEGVRTPFFATNPPWREDDWMGYAYHYQLYVWNSCGLAISVSIEAETLGPEFPNYISFDTPVYITVRTVKSAGAASTPSAPQ